AVLETLGRHEEARGAFNKALALGRKRSEALVSRGITFVALRRFEDALAAFDEALAVDEHDLTTLVNRGVVLVQLGRAQEALAVYDRVLEIEPDHRSALSSRALALAALRRHDEVWYACDKPLPAKARDAEVLYIRAIALWSMDKPQEALQCFEQAWELGHARSLTMLAIHRLTVADWRQAAELPDTLRRRIAAGDFIYPFVAAVLGLDPLDQRQAATNYLRTCLPHAPQPLCRPEPIRSDRLRIAYMSSDFRSHAVALAIAELLERHDRSRFEVIGVSLHPNDGSPIRARIVKAFECFRDASFDTDETVARRL